MVRHTRRARLTNLHLERLEERLNFNVSLASVPVFNSLPGSSHQLYLDFNGNPSITWQGRTTTAAPAYDLDGDLNSFSDVEISSIRRICQSVAEDFAPFNVNVTTVDPGSFNENQAIHVIIGGSCYDWYKKPGANGAGGVAPIGGFNGPGSNSMFAFVKECAEGDAETVAEVISHEAGHSFGLDHQSTYTLAHPEFLTDADPKNDDQAYELENSYAPGDDKWAPIMGVSYYTELSIWTTGHPEDHYTPLQDDIAILTSALGARADDHKATTTTATDMQVSGLNRRATGIITTSSDQDYFRFTTGGGTLTATLNGDDFNPNLDAVLELRDSSGNLIASNNPTDSIDAKLTQSVTAGTYYLVAKSNGMYGRIGQYTLSVDTPTGASGPKVLSSSPSSTNSASVSYVDFTFDQDMNQSSFVAGSDVPAFTGPGGTVPSSVTSGSWLSSRVLRVAFNPRTASGSYTLSIGPNILSSGGVAMNQDGDGTNGETTADRASATFSVSPPAITADGFENNDTFATASNLGTTINRTINNLTVEAGDSDYYKFVAAATGTATVRIDFSHASGDVDMRAFNSSQSQIATSLGSTDSESFSFAVTAGQTYFVNVFGGFGSTTNPSYSLAINAPAGATGDRYEANETFATATQFGEPDRVERDLSIHTASDMDIYQYRSSQVGSLTVFLQANGSGGPLQMILYNFSQVELARTTAGTNLELTIPVRGSLSTTFIKVVGVDGSTNTNYTLTIDGSAYTPDQFESNDTIATAVQLGAISSTIVTGGNIQTQRDNDYYAFVATQTGPLDIAINTPVAYNEVDLAVTGPSGNNMLGRIAADLTGGHTRTVTIDAVAGVTYYVLAYSDRFQLNQNYTVLIGTTGIAPDAQEADDSFETARDLGFRPNQTATPYTIHRTFNDDYLTFVATASGTATFQSTYQSDDPAVDLVLFDANRNVLVDTVTNSSLNTSGSTSFTFDVVNGQRYYLRARGRSLSVVPEYSLTINAPEGPIPPPITPPTVPGTPPTVPGTPPTVPGTPPTVPGTPPTVPGTPPTVPGTPPLVPGVTPTKSYSVGSGIGSTPAVVFLNPDGSERFRQSPFEAAFTGGVRTATGDVNRDGTPDVIVGPGPGRGPEVKVFNGVDGTLMFSYFAFEESFLGGIYVATGDFNGDGFADILVSPDEGGGPRIQIRSGADQSTIADFFGIDDASFRGGARVAVADINGDGKADLMVGAGFGGGPRLAVFNGIGIAGDKPEKLFPDFFVFEQTLRNGIFLTGGDLNGDGFADIFAGGGPGGGPRIFALSGKDLVESGNTTQTQLANFFAGNANNRGGVRITIKDLDGDNRADLVTGAGPGGGTGVISYLGKDIPSDGTPTEFTNADAFSGLVGGVFVG